MRRWIDRVRVRGRALFRARDVDAEMEREMRLHLDEQIEISRPIARADLRSAQVTSGVK